MAERIEKQFTRLDTAVAALERVQAGLARYKASVLKAAVEGRLVPQDPDAEPADVLLQRILAERRAMWEGGAHARARRTRSRRGRIRPSCRSCRLGGFGRRWSSSLGMQDMVPLKSATTLGEGPPVLRIPNIAGGSVDLSDLKYAVQADNLKPEQALEPNDFLVIRTNGSRNLIGRSSFVPSTIRFRVLLCILSHSISDSGR